MRYYSLCQFTPSVSAYRRSKFTRVYAYSPEGFIFHDTEDRLDVEHIRKALYRLADVHQQDETGTVADTALVVRVDDNTLAATFSMAGLPKPVKVYKGYWAKDNNDTDWLATSNLSGWYITSVKDSSVPATPINYSGLYDHCENLMRLMGNCPCELQATGECQRQLVWSKLPEQFQDPVIQRSAYTLKPDMFRKVKYKDVDGFRLVSGSHTTVHDFNDAIRPWDNHDFNQVEDRKHELSVRGKARHVKESARKAICTTCVFSARSYKGNVSDCGQLSRCTQGIGETDAWDTLYYWLDVQSGFMNMPGFTEEQRQHLIRLSGVSITTRVLYESRQTKTKFGGFRITADGDWAYYMSAGAGYLGKTKAFKSYQELQAALNAKTHTLDDAPPIVKPLSKKILLACATLGRHRNVTQAYQGYHPVTSIVSTIDNIGTNESFIELNASSGNYVNIRWVLYESSNIASYVEKNTEIDFSNMAARFSAITTERHRKRHLPVVQE